MTNRQTIDLAALAALSDHAESLEATCESFDAFVAHNRKIWLAYCAAFDAYVAKYGYNGE